MNGYVDASVFLRRILQQPGALGNWSAWRVLYASELVRVEISRSLHRAHIGRLMTDEEFRELVARSEDYLDGMELIPISHTILASARSSFPFPLGSLDAIHLVTALHIRDTTGDPLVILTHDVELAEAARLSGFEIQPPPRRV